MNELEDAIRAAQEFQARKARELAELIAAPKQGWLPCQNPGREPDYEIVWCWKPCEPCHDSALEVRRKLVEVGPEGRPELEWSAITRIVERTA